MPELWDLYNRERQKTGVVHERDKPVPQGFYHLVVSVWIVNSQGQYLMSQRHPGKPYPLLWECTGGSALAGESSLQGAVREVKEELGLTLDTNTAQLVYQTRRDESQDFYDVWRFHSGVPTTALKLQTDEVIAARWLNKNEIYKLLKSGKLHPLIDYLDLILGLDYL
ncbi:MAG: NUDIX domain-containing protein [Clostridiales bacterium]|nr:NUDIX domain-containing protein [Clostridiales bacterium]